jgi:hypothetical protein
MFYKAACYLMLFCRVCKPKSKLDSFSQVMVTNVTSLLKTVKAVEDEHCRGTRALEATIEAIGQEIRVSNHLSSTKNYKLINFTFFRLCSQTNHPRSRSALRTWCAAPNPSPRPQPRRWPQETAASRMTSLWPPTWAAKPFQTCSQSAG